MIKSSLVYNDDRLRQFRLENGLVVSMGNGEGHYASEDTYEVAILSSTSRGRVFLTEALGESFDDEVLPYMDVNECIEVIERVNGLTAEEVDSISLNKSIKDGLCLLETQGGL